MTIADAPAAHRAAGLRGPVEASPSERLLAWSGPRLTVIGLVLLAFSRRWEHIGIPVSLDRPVLMAGIALCAFDFFRRGGRLALRLVHVLLVGSMVWGVLSAISVGTLEGRGLFALVDRYGFIPFALFVLAPALFPDAASRRFLARAFTVFGLYLGLTALAETLGLSVFVWPGYIADWEVGIHYGRARGPFVEAAGNGIMLVMSAAIAGFTATMDRSRGWRLVGLVTLPLCAVGVVLTLTRAAWLGAAVATVVTVLAVPRLRRWSPLIGVIGLGALALAFAVIPGLTDMVMDRSGSQSPLWDRFNTNWAAVRMLVDEPITGVGWQQAPVLMEEYVRQGDDYPVTAATVGLDVHNVFLSRLAELGLVGAFLWFGALAGATLLPLLRRAETHELQAWRVVLLPVCAIWFTAAMFGPVTYPQPNYLLWALGGLVLVRYLTDREPRPLVLATPAPPAHDSRGHR